MILMVYRFLVWFENYINTEKISTWIELMEEVDFIFAFTMGIFKAVLWKNINMDVTYVIVVTSLNIKYPDFIWFNKKEIIINSFSKLIRLSISSAQNKINWLALETLFKKSKRKTYYLPFLKNTHSWEKIWKQTMHKNTRPMRVIMETVILPLFW